MRLHKILPKRLSYIQELVFVQSWTGKIYRQIAAESGYDLDYIKEVWTDMRPLSLRKQMEEMGD